MKKELIIALLFICISMLALVGCTNQKEELNPDINSDNEIYITFDAYSHSGGILSVTEANDEDFPKISEYETMDLLASEGEKISDAMTNLGYLSIEPILHGDIFEGWMEYEVSITKNEDGLDIYEYNRVSDNSIYTTSELLNMVVPNHDITFVAKWAGIPEKDYFSEEYSEDTNDNTTIFALSANGGTMNFKDNEVDNFQFELYSYWLENGETLNSAMTGNEVNSAILVSIEKEDAEFTGWTIYESDYVFWSSEEVNELDEENTQSFLYDANSTDLKYIVLKNCTTYNSLATTEEMCDTISKGKSYYAVANWK